MKSLALRGVVAASVCVALVLALTATHAQADPMTIQITYKNKQFQPSSLTAPANTPVTLKIRNADAKAMEFESKSLRVEKVVAANSEGSINIRPLQPGSYEFFDDFNPDSRGTLVVQ
ncbi:MAG: cupredoxin domain-containing protein [Xanthobacteraceae bacterium]|nr:MAG: cupredoxin domain-containing protein [Xanthobacteraceae bacterium]